ncbi:PqiC family protein [Acinetobacter courvalinii]|uniref:PqiC family protein n=1 Tax=Acinetobacter courvalinii TaxID=280147 RepID=UPI0021D0C8AF|nr:PqiC family protein [Acinetobacter courvalinii]MCU4639555.1 PqiC family protein [Acinetobacter courvalinii]
MMTLSKQAFTAQKMIRGAGIVAATLLIAACSGSPTPNYYTLANKVTPLPSSRVKVIEVLPVGLPDRINRAPLVIQEINGRSNILDNERWTSTLGAELRDNLSAGLQQKLGAVDRYNSGMIGGKVSYRVATDFSHFDIVNTTSANIKNVEVSVAWIIKRNDPNITIDQNSTQNQQLACRMTFSQPVSASNNQIAPIVSTASTSLSRVIDAMAVSIAALDSKIPVSVAGAVCS